MKLSNLVFLVGVLFSSFSIAAPYPEWAALSSAFGAKPEDSVRPAQNVEVFTSAFLRSIGSQVAAGLSDRLDSYRVRTFLNRLEPFLGPLDNGSTDADKHAVKMAVRRYILYFHAITNDLDYTKDYRLFSQLSPEEQKLFKESMIRLVGEDLLGAHWRCEIALQSSKQRF